MTPVWRTACTHCTASGYPPSAVSHSHSSAIHSAKRWGETVLNVKPAGPGHLGHLSPVPYWVVPSGHCFVSTQHFSFHPRRRPAGESGPGNTHQCYSAVDCQYLVHRPGLISCCTTARRSVCSTDYDTPARPGGARASIPRCSAAPANMFALSAKTHSLVEILLQIRPGWAAIRVHPLARMEGRWMALL